MLIGYGNTVNAASAASGVGKTVNATVAMTGQGSGGVAASDGLSRQGRAYVDSDTVYEMAMADGTRPVDLDHYFTPGSHLDNGQLDFGDVILPSLQNVKSLQKYISSVFPDFLAKNNIPEAPTEISYDGAGNIVLPSDYPYADQLKSALKDDPKMSNALSSTYAISTHAAALKALEPMHQQLEAANGQAEIDAILERFSHLLGENRRYPEVALMFSSEGRASVMSDGQYLA